MHDIYMSTNALPDHTRPARLDASAGSRPRQKESLFAMASRMQCKISDLSAVSVVWSCWLGEHNLWATPRPNHHLAIIMSCVGVAI